MEGPIEEDWGPKVATQTISFKVRSEAYLWLEKAAREVNLVWNYRNELSYRAKPNYTGKSRWLSRSDLCHYTAGASKEFEHFGADTVQRCALSRCRSQRRPARARVGSSQGGQHPTPRKVPPFL